jgi:hypothetical protein
VQRARCRAFRSNVTDSQQSNTAHAHVRLRSRPENPRSFYDLSMCAVGFWFSTSLGDACPCWTKQHSRAPRRRAVARPGPPLESSTDSIVFPRQLAPGTLVLHSGTALPALIQRACHPPANVINRVLSIGAAGRRSIVCRGLLAGYINRSPALRREKYFVLEWRQEILTSARFCRGRGQWMSVVRVGSLGGH